MLLGQETAEVESVIPKDRWYQDRRLWKIESLLQKDRCYQDQRQSVDTRDRVDKRK